MKLSHHTLPQAAPLRTCLHISHGHSSKHMICSPFCILHKKLFPSRGGAARSS
uniref:Uncharacterized protein n=1 Tax=Arundo donax TaxID=35708 RepID=A0A0A8YBW9_ARUDO